MLEQLKKEILVKGPITLAEYMDRCLTDPEYGYYVKTNPIGSAGDFTTSPEISQMFGELLGIWVAKMWIDYGKPKQFGLVELGPGNGTLISDLLRATKKISGFNAALNICMVEISPSLKKKQEKLLIGENVLWKTTLRDLPEYPSIILANEFFDALPINQYIRNSGGWLKVMVTFKNLYKSECKELCFTTKKIRKKIIPDYEAQTLRDGDMIEKCEKIEEVIFQIAEHLKKYSGAGLIIDYGKKNNIGNTLQGVKNHSYYDILKNPGKVDLTSLVDFKEIGKKAQQFGLTTSSLKTQREFLLHLGIEARATALSKSMDRKQLYLHHKAYQRLIGENKMGNLFKVLGIRSTCFPKLEGLEL